MRYFCMNLPRIQTILYSILIIQIVDIDGNSRNMSFVRYRIESLSFEDPVMKWPIFKTYKERKSIFNKKISIINERFFVRNWWNITNVTIFIQERWLDDRYQCERRPTYYEHLFTFNQWQKKSWIITWCKGQNLLIFVSKEQ